ncbi:MAG: DUF2244 domain-containing protein [Pseudomonadota bacterium]
MPSAPFALEAQRPANYRLAMPYRWSETPDASTLTLWPHQSMTPRGFSWFIGITAVMLSLPLFAVLGSTVAWVLMVFFLVTLAATWRAITANQSARSTRELLRVTPTRVDLEHKPPKGPALLWEANPHWVTVKLRDDGPVEKYLTLRGGGREVELGRFLTPDERESLFSELAPRLR